MNYHNLKMQSVHFFSLEAPRYYIEAPNSSD